MCVVALPGRPASLLATMVLVSPMIKGAVHGRLHATTFRQYTIHKSYMLSCGDGRADLSTPPANASCQHHSTTQALLVPPPPVCPCCKADVVQHWDVAACLLDGLKHTPAAVDARHSVLQEQDRHKQCTIAAVGPSTFLLQDATHQAWVLVKRIQ